MTADGTEDLLRDQWRALMDWLEAADVQAHRDVPTGLGDWTVADLVAHLGVGLGLAEHVTSVEGQVETLSIGDYVGSYPAAAADIAAMTREAKASLGPDPLRSLDQVAHRVWTAVEQYEGDRVQARRGPMRRDDYLVTRLIELVVHGDDLWRVLAREPSPVLPQALAVVEAALADAYQERADRPPAVGGIDWVRVACGRTPSPDPALPLL